MIVDFQGNSHYFSSPQYFFNELSSDCAYEIGVQTICLKLKPEAKMPKYLIWMLQTNLIDRCTTNPYRAVSYFTLETFKSEFVVNFPTVTFYPLERINTSPSFEFKNLFGHKILEISDVIIRVNIRKRCLDSQSL